MIRLQFKYLVLAVLILITGVRVHSQIVSDSFQNSEVNKTANWIFLFYEAPGFASKNSDEKWKGVCVDIMSEFKKYVEVKYNIEITIKEQLEYKDFSNFLEDTKSANGGVFGLSTTTITEERSQEFTFSPPYITNIGMLLSNDNVPTLLEIENIAEKFKGMTAVTVENSTNEKNLLEIKDKYFPELELEYVSSFEEAMNEVINDQNKFTNVDFTFYIEAIQNWKPIKRHPGGDDPTEQFGIIMPKSSDWAPILEEFMNSGFLQSDDYKSIITKNLGQQAMRFFETLK